MIEDIQEIWHLLDTLNPIVDHLKIQELANIELDTGHILLGLDAQRHRHLLIPVPTKTKIVSDRRSSGVQIMPHPLLDGETLRLFVDLVCLKPHLHEIFSILVNEIVDIIREDSSKPDYICRQVLDRWRELLEREPSTLLEIEKLVGLFGELYFLRAMVQRNPNAIRYWTGPKGARHDFSMGSLAIEIKSTLSRHGLFVEVHGYEQLEPLQGGKLYLTVLRFEQGPSLGESLPELIESLVQYGGDRYRLFHLLAQVGIDTYSLSEYKEIRFHLREQRIYEVNEEFPRIISSSFIDGKLPKGVLKLAYQIDLSGEPPKPLDHTATDILFGELDSLIEGL